ncbi:MAG: MoaD/ThiS family protein [Methanomicrobiales archaeon]|nr:MoaD/ThiS family protein [Methanomicrobiales archaeon]
MKVNVRLGGTLAGTGNRERTIRLDTGASIGTVLESLQIGHPGDGMESRDDSLSRLDTLTILLNGENIGFLKGLSTPLVDGDVVAIFLAGEGG